jgi:hypothetical protein
MVMPRALVPLVLLVVAGAGISGIVVRRRRRVGGGWRVLRLSLLMLANLRHLTVNAVEQRVHLVHRNHRVPGRSRRRMAASRSVRESVLWVMKKRVVIGVMTVHGDLPFREW